MISVRKIILVLGCSVLVAVFCSPQLFAQEPGLSDWRDFFGLPSASEPAKTETAPFVETEAAPFVETEAAPFVETEAAPAVETEIAPRDSLDIQEENLAEPVPVPEVFHKRMVEVPAPEKKRFIDAGDFRDPFFLLRGAGGDTQAVMEPGVTVDGVQFNSYKDSDSFVEKVYRESNFLMDDVFGKVKHLDRGGGACLHCHRGIERISENHKFRCTKCHEGNRFKRTLPAAHRNLVSNPSDLDHAPKYCGNCHADQIEQVERSAMATGRGVIEATRYAWGAQAEGENIYSLRPNEDEGESLLPGLEDGEDVDVFLRTKCLRCHLQSQAPHRPGDYRASGCAACHMPYTNDGFTLSHDRAIQSQQRKNLQERDKRFQRNFASRGLENPRGYPVLHKFTTAIPSVQCEHCHNVNGIGNEFEGMFAIAARPRSAFQKTGADKPVLYGAEHEFLLPDIHRERGMHCIDCHVASDLKGAPSGPGLHAGVKIRCEDCHGTHSSEPQGMLLIESDFNTKRLLASNALNPNLKRKIKVGDTVLLNSGGVPLTHIKKDKKQWILYSRVTGKKHIIPVLAEKKPPTAHRIARHMESLECHACHARWSASEWGMHVIREENPDLSKWKDWSFTDPTLQNFLWNPQAAKSPVGMLDWLSAKRVDGKISGTKIPGVWWDIFVETDWRTMILGKNSRGKYTVMKPRYQYFLTDRTGLEGDPVKRAQPPVTETGQPGLLLLPHTPHTIRKIVRPCESCHDSDITVGLGDPARKTLDDAGSFLSALQSGDPVPSEFQTRQMVTADGVAIQTAYPPAQVRFLSAEEIAALKNRSDTYKAYRYMDLRERRFPRLLAREDFPFDRRHQKNEAAAGKPRRDKDILYHMDENRFVDRQRGESEPSMEEPPDSSETPSAGQNRILNLNPIEGEMIMEFSPDFFETVKPEEESEINESTPTSDLATDGL